MKITLRHYQSGHEIKTKKGFSWTTLFFGFFVPLFRGDVKWFFIILIVNVIVGSITAGIGLLVTWIVFPCIYNGRYISDLGKKGYIEIRDYYVQDDRLPPGEYRIGPEGRKL